MRFFTLVFVAVSGVGASFVCGEGLETLRSRFASIRRVVAKEYPEASTRIPEVVEAMAKFRATQSRFASATAACDLQMCRLAVTAWNDFVKSSNIREDWRHIRATVDSALTSDCGSPLGHLRQISH